MGVRCNSIAYINNLLFSQYCCRTCSATTTTTSTVTTTTTTTTTTTASTAANSSTTATTTTSGLTTTTCTNVNDQACQFYLNLGVRCNSASFINNVLFAVYCCKSCSTTTTTTAAVTTTATTTTTAASVTASTTTLGTCTNANDAACSYYLSVGVRCSASSFINSIPFTVYCCRACNQVVTTTRISTTTLTTTQGSAVCVDSQLSCAAWVNFCSILATYNPNPCRKTCRVC